MTPFRITVFVTLLLSSPLGAQNLPERLIVGYWHNWSFPNAVELIEVPAEYDVINVAFAVPITPFGATMTFTPDPAIYPNPTDFAADIAFLQNQGKKVQISIGGGADPVHIENATDVDAFVNSMLAIIYTYGFDGIDIDLEGQSLYLEAGDDDFRNPTSPLIVNAINAIQLLLAELPLDFMLTAAPETAFVQGGYGSYGGVWGAYLPVIHALRDEWTYLHVQHYNSGSMYGLDGMVYEPATADFHVAMAEMLLAGFEVFHPAGDIFFEPLAENQVLIGLPASPDAAGSGYTDPATVHQALDYLILGEPYGGVYQLANPDGYFTFRGLMTWSINWDLYNGSLFIDSHRPYLDGLADPTSIEHDSTEPLTPQVSFATLLPNYPNPFNPTTTLSFQLKRAASVSLRVYNSAGQQVAVLIDGYRSPGDHQVTFNASGLSSGTYFYELRADREQAIKRMILLK